MIPDAVPPGDYQSQIESIYDSRAILPFKEETYRESIAADVAVLANFHPAVDSYLCDVGCGYGYHMRQLHRLGYKNVWGIDLSSQSLDPLLDRAICGDVMKWGVRGFFDMCFSLLACIGAGSANDNLQYLRAMSSISRPGATLILSSFCTELADSLSGSYAVQYDISQPVVVHSCVTYNMVSRRLTIKQTAVEDNQAKVLPTEKLTLCTCAELVQLAADAGWVDVTTFMPGQRVADALTLSGKGRVLLVGQNSG